MAKCIMLQGTSSGAGKTTIALALCRIFKQDGYRVAPFKSQNMTSNTARTGRGEEIAVAQWVQAYASELEPDTAMNPVILKPSAQGTQIVLNGQYHDTVNAQDLSKIKVSTLLPEIMKAYASLDESYDIIVIEGAGSPVELNLNKNDIVNMGIATRVKAPVLLVSDIDRGGVFASLFGTIGLFEENEKNHVKATIVNRFKGNIDYFAEGISILEKITGVPVAGVVPHMSFNLPDEDDLIPGSGNESRGTAGDFDTDAFETEFDNIAEITRSALNMKLIYDILDNGI